MYANSDESFSGVASGLPEVGADNSHLPSETTFVSASTVASRASPTQAKGHAVLPARPQGFLPCGVFSARLPSFLRESLPRVSAQGERCVAAKPSTHCHGRDRTESCFPWHLLLECGRRSMVNCIHRACRRNPPLTCALSHLLNVRSLLIASASREGESLLLYKQVFISEALCLFAPALLPGIGPSLHATAHKHHTVIINT